MRATKLIEVLRHCIKNRRSLLIVGQPGVGKTDCASQAADLEESDFLLMHPAVSDPTDFKGMPALVVNGAGKNGNTKAEFLPFGDLRRLIEATKRTLVLVDDLIQAPTAVQAALMQLVLARQVNGKRISDEVVFVGATNDVSDRAGGTGLIEPLKSRWDSVIRFEVSVDDWTRWAMDHNQPTELIAFIRCRPELLCQFVPSREIKSYPCPRTWASVGRWFNEGLVDHEIFSGVVGNGAATEFVSFLQLMKEAPNLDAIIMDPDCSPIPSKPGILYMVVSGLARKATKGNFEKILRYASRLPKEFEVCLVRDGVRTNVALTQCSAYIEWGIRNQDVLS